MKPLEQTTPPTAPTAQRALDCLEELALEKGLDDVSMRDVARSLGISLASLQYHYPNKAALLDAFVDEKIKVYRQTIFAILEQSPNGRRLASLVRFAAEEAMQPDRYRILSMIEGRASHDDAAKRAMSVFSQAYIDIVREAVTADFPDLHSTRAIVAASLIVAMLEGLPSIAGSADQAGLEGGLLIDAVVEAAISIVQRPDASEPLLQPAIPSPRIDPAGDPQAR